MLNILIVEDEDHLGLTLKDYLSAKGHHVTWAQTGLKAMGLFRNQKFDLILMDIGLPDTDGITLGREMRAIRKNFVLLFLSAQNDPEVKVKGLEIGAEDYITKPFALKELMLRLNRVLKFQKEFEDLPEEIIHGKLKIWFRRFEVEDAFGHQINLSQKECAILEYLYKRKNEAIDRNDIIEKIWGEDKFPSNRTVDNYIVKLRKWCESDESRILEIHSIRSIGYKLTIASE